MSCIVIYCNRSELNDFLISVKKVSPKLFKSGKVQIKTKPDQIQLLVMGVSNILSASCNYNSEVLIPLHLLHSYTSTSKQPFITMEISEGSIVCGISKHYSSEIKMINPINYAIDNLTINPDDYTLLKYSKKCEESFLAEHNLLQKISAAKVALQKNIKNAHSYLSQYRVTLIDIEKLIDDKLKID